MKTIKITKEVSINLGGLILKHGLVQGDHYRFWSCSPFSKGNARKMLNVQVCKNKSVVYSQKFFVGSQNEAKRIQKECMNLFNIKMRYM